MTYHDYVIKDGRFIGRFEEMYQKFDDPWHQQTSWSDSYTLYSTGVSTRKYGCRSLLEVGSGLGAGTACLAGLVPNMKIDGMDISQTAVKKAQETYPELSFFVGDLLTYSQTGDMGYDALLFSQIMWYILDDLDAIIANLTKRFCGRIIMINQTFYNPGIQTYGKEYFTSLDEMCSYLPWKCLDQILEMRPQEESIQTHSVFRVLEETKKTKKR